MIDALGATIKVGDKVLTGSYWSATFDTVTTVKKVNRTTIGLELPCTYDISGYRKVKRRPYQMIVVDKQLEYNQKAYPENFI